MARGSRNGIAREIRSTRRFLRTLDNSLRRLATMLSQLNGRTIDARPLYRLSPKARASLKLHGRYMGYMKQLTPRQKAQVRRVKEAEGGVGCDRPRTKASIPTHRGWWLRQARLHVEPSRRLFRQYESR
jgi:hypothetical protein